MELLWASALSFWGEGSVNMPLYWQNISQFLSIFWMGSFSYHIRRQRWKTYLLWQSAFCGAERLPRPEYNGIFSIEPNWLKREYLQV